MKRVDLVDDVLLEIFSYLFGEDALNVVLTAKRLYPLALPRVFAELFCSCPTGKQLHPSVELSSKGPDDHYRGYHWCNFSQASLIGDILLRANRLQTLIMKRFQPCLDKDPRIGTALKSMTQLKDLRLYTVGDRTMTVLRACQFDLDYLALHYFGDADACPIPNERMTFGALIPTLAAFRHLTEVALHSFVPKTALGDDFEVPLLPSALEDDFEIPLLPSVRSLRLASCSPKALDLIELCPRLEDLWYSSGDARSAENSSHHGHRWPALRCLTMINHRDIPCVLSRIGPVERVRFDQDTLILYNGDKSPITNLCDLLQLTSPAELSLQARADNAPLDLGKLVSAAIPKLRVLSLKWSRSQRSSTREANKDWLSKLPGLLSPLQVSVVYLNLVNIEYKPKRPEIGMEILPHLPRRLAEAMPSLQYLAILDEVSRLGTLPLPGADRNLSKEGDASLDGADTTGTDRADEQKAGDNESLKCWRIVGGAEGKKLERITWEEWVLAHSQAIWSVRKGEKLDGE
ncbi:hypothetical protein FKP32DRAFT_1678549 [Trametes sanguinea]|nr:hypothetical protein FKP32DRAFT_1678549 [Trametes sanguinea]